MKKGNPGKNYRISIYLPQKSRAYQLLKKAPKRNTSQWLRQTIEQAHPLLTTEEFFAWRAQQRLNKLYQEKASIGREIEQLSNDLIKNDYWVDVTHNPPRIIKKTIWNARTEQLKSNPEINQK